MENSNAARSNGTSVCAMLLVLFIALKLIGIQPVAGWSWWWVMSPMWLPLAIVLGIFGIVLFVAAAIKS